MIDEEWLQQINYDFDWPGTLADGRTVKIDGFLGLGAHVIVFSGITQDGEQLACKINRDHLGFHIRELPLLVTRTPRYDLDRLNQKLLGLIRHSSPILDIITPQYNDLYDLLIAFIKEHGLFSLTFLDFPSINETLPFILNTPGMKSRLQELADAEGTDLLDQVADLFPVKNPNIRPDTLFNNPMYVWGAAAMDGFFTDEELPLAVKFIEEHFGRLASHPQTLTFLEQNFAMAHLLAQFVHVPSALRFVELCRLAGFFFRVADREYKILEATDYKNPLEAKAKFATLKAKAKLTIEEYDKAVTELKQEYDDASQLEEPQETTFTLEFKQTDKQILVELTSEIQREPTATRYFNRGNICEKLQRYDEAEADYNSALQLEPTFAEVYNNRGLLFNKLQRYQEALEDFTRAIELNPTLAQTYYNRGNTYYALQRYKEALADYIQATQLNPTYKSAYNNCGLTYARLRRYNDALNDLTRAIELDPNDAISYDNRGLTYTEMGHHVEALKDFTQAIQIQPSLARLYNNRGSTYESLGRYEEALEDFTQSIKVDPAYARGYLSMGALLADRGALEEALPYLEEAEQLGDQLAPHYIAQVKGRPITEQPTLYTGFARFAHTERVEIRKRLWVLLVMHTVPPTKNLRSFVIDDSQKPDLLLLEVKENLYKRWHEAVSEQCGSEWEVRQIQSDLATIAPSLAGVSLVVGKRKLVIEFFESVGPEIISGHYPELPDPSEVPRMPEENFLDPFGQNTNFLDSAWLRMSNTLGYLTSKAHARRMAVTLPASFDKLATSQAQPGQTLVSLTSPTENISSLQTLRQMPELLPDEDEVTAGLILLQRCLLVAIELESNKADNGVWTLINEIIESLGYILVSHSMDMREVFRDDYSNIGKAIATLHSLNIIHGDLHPGNIVGTKVTDFMKSCELSRPLTILERAKDLALLKLHWRHFLSWEAIKLGYRSIAPEEAEEVFKLL